MWEKVGFFMSDEVGQIGHAAHLRCTTFQFTSNYCDT
jgi:hypothetical protein